MSTITSGLTMGQAFNLMASRYLVKEYSVGASCAAAHCLMLGSLDHGSQHKFTPTLRTEQSPMLAPELLWPGVTTAGQHFKLFWKFLLSSAGHRQDRHPSTHFAAFLFSVNSEKSERRNYIYAEWFLAEVGIGSSFDFHYIQQIKTKLIKVLRTRQHQKLQAFPYKFDILIFWNVRVS